MTRTTPDVLQGIFRRYLDPSFCTDLEYRMHHGEIIASAKTALASFPDGPHSALEETIHQLVARARTLDEEIDREYVQGVVPSELQKTNRAVTKRKSQDAAFTKDLLRLFPDNEEHIRAVQYAGHRAALKRAYDLYTLCVTHCDSDLCMQHYKVLQNHCEEAILNSKKAAAWARTDQQKVTSSANGMNLLLRKLMRDAYYQIMHPPEQP